MVRRLARNLRASDPAPYLQVARTQCHCLFVRLYRTRRPGGQQAGLTQQPPGLSIIWLTSHQGVQQVLEQRGAGEGRGGQGKVGERRGGALATHSSMKQG